MLSSKQVDRWPLPRDAGVETWQDPDKSLGGSVARLDTQLFVTSCGVNLEDTVDENNRINRKNRKNEKN